MYRAGSLRAITEEISKYNLHLVGVSTGGQRGWRWHRTSRHFRNKRKEYLKGKIDELAMNRTRILETCIQE
jgi:hypothetical protein